MESRGRANTGLLLALVSGAAFGTSGAFAASLIAVGWTPGAAVLARVAIAAVVLTPFGVIALHRHRHPVTSRAVVSVLVYGLVAVAGAQLCYFNAVHHLSVAVALLLEYFGILLVVGWQWARHGHRPARPTLLGGAVAVTGLILVLDLFRSPHLDVTGVLWGLGAAVGLAVYFVISSGTDDALPAVTVAWVGLAVGATAMSVAAAVGALRLHAVSHDVTLMHSHVSWLVPVGGMSLIAAVVAYATGITAARLLGAKLASFVGLTEVLFAVLFAWWLVGQRLDVVQGLGGVLVVGGIALVRWDELGDRAARTVGPPRHHVTAPDAPAVSPS